MRGVYEALPLSDEADPDILLTLADNPAFLMFLSLLKGVRRDRMEALANYVLKSQDAIIGATMLQGTIAGIDAVVEILLSIADNKAEEAAQRESAVTEESSNV